MKKHYITSFFNSSGESCGIYENEEQNTYFLRLPGSRVDMRLRRTCFSVVVNYVKSLGFTEET